MRKNEGKMREKLGKMSTNSTNSISFEWMIASREVWMIEWLNVCIKEWKKELSNLPSVPKLNREKASQEVKKLLY
jgi:hypothetical protein